VSLTFNQRVDGSNPSGLTNKIKDLKAFYVRSGDLSLALGPLVKGGPLTAVDHSPSAPAAHALNENQSGVMVAFQPPELKFVPLAESLNKVRTAPADSLFVQIARSLGISLGD
jgi:hypothetical protein